MRRVVGSVVVGALVSLLVRVTWAQAKDIEATLTFWPTMDGTGR